MKIRNASDIELRSAMSRHLAYLLDGWLTCIRQRTYWAQRIQECIDARQDIMHALYPSIYAPLAAPATAAPEQVEEVAHV
jgi:hypothetical protein